MNSVVTKTGQGDHDLHQPSHGGRFRHSPQLANFYYFVPKYVTDLIYYGPRRQSESAIFNVTLDLRSVGIWRCVLLGRGSRAMLD